MADKYQLENAEHRAKMQKICDFFKMGRVLTWTSLKITAPCMSLLKLQTNQGTYSIKEYASLKKNQLKNVFYIKKILSTHQIPLYLSLSDAHQNDFIYEDETSCWSVTPWVFGENIKISNILTIHIEQIAKILGKIHKLQINFPELPSEVLLELSHVLFDHIDAAGVGSDKIDPKFKHWRNLFDQHAEVLKEDLVISHGDLLPQNVIWETDQKPILIDWDNAGWINQDIDLFNTAINWAGIESGIFNRSHYDYFIDIYRIENPRKIQIDKASISASLGSWLNWLFFNDKQGHQEAVNMTLRSLKILEREFF